MKIRLDRLASIAAGLTASGLLAQTALAELVLPRVSPKASVSQTIGLTDITVTYSRPGVKGRVIWGGLVPFDEPWRTGANEATSITLSDDITVEGKPLAAGTYSLLTIPTKDKWTVVFNKEEDLWGAFGYKPEQDVLRVDIQPESAPHVEWMSFGFSDLTPNSARLVLRWEKLLVPIEIEVDVVSKALANARTEIAAAKADDWRTPYQAANYCFNSKVNMDEAMTWAQKSIAAQETFYNLSLLAKMMAEKGRTKEALSLAKKAVQVGKASKDSVDTRPTERLIAEWTGK